MAATQDELIMLFRVLLYRYFFFDWLFEDANKGNVYQRNAARIHNREQAHWLITYLKRWVTLSLLFAALGALFEVVSPLLSAFFYVPSVISVAVNSIIGVMLSWLKWFP